VVLAISLALLVWVLLISYVRNGTLMSINVVFSAMWCICLALSTLGLYGIYRPSDTVYIMSFSAIVVFNLVYFAGSRSIHNTLLRRGVSRSVKPMLVDGDIRFGLLYALNLGAYAYSLPFMPKAIAILKSYGFAGLRQFAFAQSSAMATTHQLLVFQWIVEPIFTVTTLVTALLFTQRRGTTVLTLITLIDLCLYSALFGGRYALMRALMYFIFAALIVNQGRFLQTVKRYRALVLVIVVLVAGLVVVTGQRSIAGKGFFGNVIVYYTGSFTYLSKTLETRPWDGHLLLGAGTFGFITNFMWIAAKMLFGVNYAGSDYIVTQITQYYMRIADTVAYNALTTMLFPFIMDFGYVGVVVGTAAFAWAAARTESFFYRRQTIFSLGLYVLLLFACFDSVLQYEFLFPSTAVTLLLLLLFTYRWQPSKKHVTQVLAWNTRTSG